MRGINIPHCQMKIEIKRMSRNKSRLVQIKSRINEKRCILLKIMKSFQMMITQTKPATNYQVFKTKSQPAVLKRNLKKNNKIKTKDTIS